MKPKLGVVPTTLPEPPYPEDTKVRGWCFQIDHERLFQSDTWALATPDMRPWLLMLWHTAWVQIPAGGFTNDDQLIAARIGMDSRIFVAHRDILLRGMVLHSDQRFYHPVVVDQVLDYLALRERKTKNQRDYKKRKSDRSLTGQRPVSDRSVTAPEPEPEPEPEKKKEKKGSLSQKTEESRKEKPGFTKPTIGEVRAYTKEQKLANVDPEAFMDHFDSNGWKVSGKAPMKDWKASVRGWSRRDFNGNGKAKSYINGGI